MKREKASRKSTKKPSSAKSFSVLLWRLLAAFQIFFFSAFSFVSKKSSKSALWEEIAQSFQTDTRAVVSQKKKLLSFILYNIHTNSIALSVEHTK